MTDEQQMRPGVHVRVVAPTEEHQAYLGKTGCINDVRDFGPRRFCLLDLEEGEQLSCEVTELKIVIDGDERDL